MDWPTAGAVVGAAGIITGGIMKVFGSSSKRDEAVLDALLKNQTDQTRILDRLTMLIEHRDTRTEELHRDTHAKLDRVASNQETMIKTVQDGFSSLLLR